MIKLKTILTEMGMPQFDAQKTARNSGAVGANAIVPRYVSEVAKKGDKILNFGSGVYNKSTNSFMHSDSIRKATGADVYETDLPGNVQKAKEAGIQTILSDPSEHAPYDIVFASNVLNTVTSLDMVFGLIKKMKSLGGDVYFNFPLSPNYTDGGNGKMDRATYKAQMENLIRQFGNKMSIVRGSAMSNPIFKI